MPKTVDTHGVRRLLEEGAQLVDVLPPETYAQEHIAGAVNIPLADIASAPERLDHDRPVIVYCYDYQCDLSPRAARHLELLGLSDVYDYVASRAAWLAAGLAGEGMQSDEERAGAATRADVPTVGPDATVAEAAAVVGNSEVVVVVDERRTMLGTIRSEALDGRNGDHPVMSVLHTAVPTVRPSIPIRELAKSMDDDGETHVLVTTFDGKLVGLVRRDDLDGL